MKILLEDTFTLNEVKKQFHLGFPYLKIEFFNTKHKTFEATKQSQMIRENLSLKDLTSKEGSLEVNKDMTVEELEKKFFMKFGLNVQVFRKSGKSWLETTITDKWTLEKQNAQGEELDVLNKYDEQ
jgi:hypothetical protein